MPDWLHTYVFLYAVLAMGHLIVQIVLAHIDWRTSELRERTEDPGFAPSVSVIVPAYNEEPRLLGACVRSLVAQDYPQLQVIIVDDGSADIAAHEWLAEVYSDRPEIEFLALERNRGKRAAQMAVLRRVTGELLVTIDSDTCLHDRWTLRRMVQRFADPRVGVVTADVRVQNTPYNLLTRLISARYWTAFHQERAAQSLFGVMLCASGPLAAYRTEVVREVARDYTCQMFLGQVCTFGDDRHLTNLFLARGYRSVFERRSRAYTNVPRTLSAYLRQQVRWNKSFFREALWTMRFLHRRHPYMALDLLLQTILPFLLLGALVATAYQTAFISHAAASRYVLVLLAIGILRAGYGLIRERDSTFLVFPLYGFLHVFVLIPLRVWALLTIGRTQWGSRTATVRQLRTASTAGTMVRQAPEGGVRVAAMTVQAPSSPR